jgi:secreted trypsin-like serine protease
LKRIAGIATKKKLKCYRNWIDRRFDGIGHKKMYPQATIYGIDTNETTKPLLGVIDAGSMIDLHAADFVIVSVPVDGALATKYSDW